MSLHVTDHAVLRFLERVHGLELEKLRAELRAKAERDARMMGEKS